MKIRFHQYCYTHATRGVYGDVKGWQVVGVSDKKFFHSRQQKLSMASAIPEVMRLPKGFTLYAFQAVLDTPVLIRVIDADKTADNRPGNMLTQILLPETAKDANNLFHCDLLSVFNPDIEAVFIKPKQDNGKPDVEAKPDAFEEENAKGEAVKGLVWIDEWGGEPEPEMPILEIDFSDRSPQKASDAPNQSSQKMIDSTDEFIQNRELLGRMIRAARLALDPANPRYLVVHPPAAATDHGRTAPDPRITFFRILWNWLAPPERKTVSLWIGRQQLRIPGTNWLMLAASDQALLNASMLGRSAYGFDFPRGQYTGEDQLKGTEQVTLPADQEDIAAVITQRNAAYERIAEQTGYTGTNREKWDRLLAIFAEMSDGQSISAERVQEIVGVLKAFNEQEKNPPGEYLAAYNSILQLVEGVNDLKDKQKYALEALKLPFPAKFPEDMAKQVFTRLIDFLRHVAETQKNPAEEEFHGLLSEVADQLEKLQAPTLHSSRQEAYFWKPIFEWKPIIEQTRVPAGNWQLLKALLYLDFQGRKYRFLQLITHAPQPLPAGADGVIPAEERTWYQAFFQMIRDNNRTTTMQTPLPMQQIHQLYKKRPETAEFEMLIGYLDSRGGIEVADWIRLYQAVNATAHRAPVLERYFAAISSSENLHEDPGEDSLYDTFLEAKDANLLAREIACRLASVVQKGADSNPAGIIGLPIKGEDQKRIASYFKNILADPGLYGNFKPQQVARREENVLFQAVGEDVHLCKLLLGGAYNHIYEQLTAPRSAPDERRYGIADIYRVMRTVGFCAEIVPGAWFPDTFPKEPRDKFHTQILKTILREFYQSPVKAEDENWARNIIRNLELARFLAGNPAREMLVTWFAHHGDDTSGFAPLARVFNLFANPYRTAPPIQLQANRGLQPNDLSMVLTQHDTNPAFHILDRYYATQQTRRYRNSDTFLTEFLSCALCCRDEDRLKQEWQLLRVAVKNREYATPLFFRPLLRPLFQITRHVCRKFGRYDVLKNEYLEFAFGLMAMAMRDDPAAAEYNQNGEIWIDYVKIIKNEAKLIQSEIDLTKQIEKKINSLRGKSSDQNAKNVEVLPQIYQNIYEVKPSSTKESQQDYLRYILENHATINLLEEEKNLKFYQLHDFIAQYPKDVSKLLIEEQRYDLITLLNLLLGGVKSRPWEQELMISKPSDPIITLTESLKKGLKNKEAKKSFFGKSTDIRSLLPGDERLRLLFDFSRIYFEKIHYIDNQKSLDKLLLLELIARHDDDKFQEALARAVLDYEGINDLVQLVVLLNFYLAVHNNMSNFTSFLKLVTQYYKKYAIQKDGEMILPLFEGRIEKFAEALVIILEENNTSRWDYRLEEIWPFIHEFIIAEFLASPNSRIIKKFELSWPSAKMEKSIEELIENKVRKNRDLYITAYKNFLAYLQNKQSSRRTLK